MTDLARHTPFAVLATAAIAAALPAQDPGRTTSVERVVTEERVREVVTWLAADERRGRDTPSPELEAAADWLTERFQEAGLKAVPGAAWAHEYTLPGVRLDSTAITVTIGRKEGEKKAEFELVPDEDVRLYRPADVKGGDEEPATVAKIGDPVLRQLLRANSARRPIILEVPEDHPYWVQSAGKRSMLTQRRRASRPIFVVRDGILPAHQPGGAEPGWAATWTAPLAEATEIPLRNVVGLLPGTTKSAEFVVVSAHYDHVGVGTAAAGDSIYNGADDNATGTTAVVLLAEALAKMPAPQRSILFVCFSAEEKGLRGSRAFCERPPVPREQIVANVNIEMIGRPEEGKQNHAWITGAEFSDFATIAAAVMPAAGVEITEFRMARQLFRASDNYPFVQHGIVAHSISAGSLHADYHKPSDEIGKLDIPHMTQIIRGLAAFVRDLADRETPPQWNEAGKAMLESSKRRRRGR